MPQHFPGEWIEAEDFAAQVAEMECCLVRAFRTPMMPLNPDGLLRRQGA